MTKIQKIVLLLALAEILLLIIPIASAYSKEDIEWKYVGSATLYKGETYTSGDYIVEAADFDIKKGLVFLNLKKGNLTLNKSILNVSGEIRYNDEVKVIITELSGDPVAWVGDLDKPHVEIEFYVREKPSLSIKIKTYKEEYDPSAQYIYLTIELENNGGADLEDVKVNIDTGGLYVIEGFIQNYFKVIEASDSETIRLKLKIPYLMEKKSFKILVNASGVDIKKVAYSAKNSKTIPILPVWKLQIQKNITNPINVNSSARVDLKIKNTGLIDINSIELIDTIPKDFKLENMAEKNNKTILWNLNLTPNEEKHYSYFLKPLKIGFHNLPSAKAYWSRDGKHYSAESNELSIIVNGSYVILTKTVSPTIVELGDVITVTLSVHNTGNAPAKIRVEDKLPLNTELINGSTIMDQILKANETSQVDYTLKMQSLGRIKFPKPQKALGIADLENMAVVLVVNKTAPKPTPTLLSPEAVIKEALPNLGKSWVAIILLVVYLVIKRIK
ncbi:MAG: hypothetical protein ACE5KE_09485 [Methanosarcinales archaeon]